MSLDNLVSKLAVYPTDQGPVTHQQSGEEYTPDMQSNVLKFPGGYQANKNLLTSQYVDNVYRSFINSEEGREFVQYLGKTGNKRPNTGSIDDIFVVNKGKGLVAATYPGKDRGNLLVNADYIHQFCRQMSGQTGLSYDSVLTEVIKHELRHFYGQGMKEWLASDQYTEAENDIGLIKFNLDMAKKNPEEKAKYLAKAKMHTKRYYGQLKGMMNKYIAAKTKEIKKEGKVVSIAAYQNKDMYKGPKKKAA